MLLDIELKLKTPFLGSSKQDESGVRKIRRDINGKPVFYTRHFINVLCNYAASLGIKYFPSSAIEFIANLEVNEDKYPVTIFSRRYYDKSVKGFKEDKFESFSAGSVICLKCLLHEDKITIKTFSDVLELTGTLYGTSPFGAKWNYGLFEVQTITPAKGPLGANTALIANLNSPVKSDEAE